MRQINTTTEKIHSIPKLHVWRALFLVGVHNIKILTETENDKE